MSTYRSRTKARTALTVSLALVAVLLVAGIAAIALVHHQDTTNAGSHGNTDTTTHTTQQQTAEAVAWTSPKAGQTGVSPAGPIVVHLTQALAPGSPMPTITPNVSGTWALTAPTTLTFEPSASLVPFQTYTVTVPGGSDGLRGKSGDHLAANVQIGFKIEAAPFLRLQQVLAQLNYLPVSFTPQTTTALPADQEAMTQLGTFNWRWPNMPSTLTSLFVQGDDDVLTQGAVMMFESLHGLATDGIAGPDVWSDLLQAVANNQLDPNPWDWIYVQKTPVPEQLYAWSNGKVVFQTAANTGAQGVQTPDGSWPVYLHWATTTMQGTNPNGTKYDDKNVLWVSYFYKGDALHAFLRGSYGTPQSLGCVEMPTASAAKVFPLTPIGTVVTVQ
ncbi:MAG: L,D-transpeptidase family protein [Acidimicrobiales bacterium]